MTGGTPGRHPGQAPRTGRVTQVTSATRALQQAAAGLLSDHLRHCVRDAARRGDADTALAEAAGTIRQVARL